MITYSLLDSSHPVLVHIHGQEVCTEEAAMTWEKWTSAERAQFQGMTDVEIVTHIYSCPQIGFNYLRATV